MRFLALLCVVTALVLTGCRKKSAPEFYKLEADQSILVARDGDDAWLSPEMGAILSQLQAIPEGTVEKERAAALASKIAAEQARVKAEQLPPKPTPAPVDPFAGRTPSVTPEAAPETPPPAPEVASDGGEVAEPAMPWPGMDEKTFVARFGSCFAAGPKATLPDGRPGSSYVLSASAECQKQFGAPNTAVSYLFTEKGLWGKASETTQVRDAGTILIPPTPSAPVPQPPPGPPALTPPGAPLPDGYEKVQ